MPNITARAAEKKLKYNRDFVRKRVQLTLPFSGGLCNLGCKGHHGTSAARFAIQVLVSAGEAISVTKNVKGW